MAENYAICLLGAMDRLWFHQIILLSAPSTFIFPKNYKTPLSISDSLSYPSSSNSSSLFSEEDTSTSVPRSNTPSQDDLYEDTDKEIKVEETPTRIDNISNKSRSHSSPPSTQQRSRNLRLSNSGRRLHKTMSCKSLLELELEEVKGFMDLGFIFSKEHLTPRMMSVIPGLQRFGDIKIDQNNMLIGTDEVDKDDDDDDDDDGIEEGNKERRGVMRPYLSEAWLIKRPDSPLLNLRIPRVSTATDMKKHLKYWARTVASVIQQES